MYFWRQVSAIRSLQMLAVCVRSGATATHFQRAVDVMFSDDVAL